MYQPVLTKYRKQGYLLLDDLYVADADGCRLRFHQAVKDPANPIITATEAWEGNGCTMWGGTVLYDPDTKRYRLYYGTFEDGGAHKKSYYRGGLAESDDGLSWVKPKLYKIVYNGVAGHYACKLDEKSENPWDAVGPIGPEAVYDPRPECRPEERYKALTSKRFVGGIVASASADGNLWHYISDKPVWRACSDIIHPFWDDNKKKFVCYFKLWKIYGDEKDASSPSGFRPITALTYGNVTTEDLGDGTTAISGEFIDLHPETYATLEKRTLILRSGRLGEDDGGGFCLTGAYYMRRVVHYAESDDFIHWEHEQEVLDTDEWDRPSSNIQLAEVFPFGGYYLAFLNVHDERGHFDQQLAFSRDGIRWKRPWRGNILSYGAPGHFDSGMVGGMQPPIVTESQLIFYYGGYEATHSGHFTVPNHGIAIGRAMMRKNGFASWDAYGEDRGCLRTVVLPVNEPALSLNIDSEGGMLTAALYDENGDPVPGYTHETCDPVRGDSISYPDCLIPVSWNGSAVLPEGLQNVSVELRFYNTSVYSVMI